MVVMKTLKLALFFESGCKCFEMDFVLVEAERLRLFILNRYINRGVIGV